MNLDQIAADGLRRWKADPVAFVREVLKAEPDNWQAEALSVFPRVNRLALKAAKGCGKTTVLAWLILNFLFTRPLAQISAISISGDNLRDGLWKELAFWMGRSPALTKAFEWNQTHIVSRTDPATNWVSARQWSKSADKQAQEAVLSGLHAPYMMFVMDESGSIPQAIAVTAGAVLASGIETKLLQAGNPTSLEGPLYLACTSERDQWYVVEITGDPDDPKRAPRISLEWARDEIRKYGRDNAWVKVNVLGLFPEASINALLGVEEVTAAMKRHLLITQYEHAQKRIGTDVARFGDDLTVLFPRQGRAAFRPRAMRHARNTAVSVDIATAIIRAKTQWGSEMEFIDATGGWAAGASDVCLDSGYSLYNVQFAAPALDRRYANRRAEMWFGMSQWVQDGGALPNVPDLVGELTTPTYTFRKGQFLLEDKDQVKARLGRSPNYADALATTFALPEMPAQALAHLRSTHRAVRDADPFVMPEQDQVSRDRDPFA